MSDKVSRSSLSINKLAQFLDALPAPFVVYGPDDTLVVCNSAYQQQYHPCENYVLPGVTHTDLQWLKVNNQLDNAAEGRAKEFVREQQEAHRNGPELEEWIDDNGHHIRLMRARLPDGHVVGMRFDITDLRVAETELVEKNVSLENAKRELQKIANSDPLTGLANRRAAHNWLHARAEKTPRSGETLGILLIDLDGFKSVNDGLGHAAGDHVLEEVSRRLRNLLPSDTFLARMGGDEFLVACPGGTEATCTTLARQLIDALCGEILYNNQPCKIGASVGIAIEQSDTLDVEQLLRFADTALYRSKTDGRGCVTLFDDELQTQTARRDQIARDLASPNVFSQFHIVLQPIVDAKSRQLVSAEALVRWTHDDLGPIFPDEFLPIAQDLGMVSLIDEYVLDQVLDVQAGWDRVGLDVPKIAVNVSSQRLRDVRLLNRLRTKNIATGRISFEILETVFARDDDAILRWNLDGLQDLGIETQVDDYGTAHSSIAGLLLFRPRRIKIDRQFCAGTVDSSEARDIVRLTVALANSLKVDVTAEGVETEDQAKILLELGCDRLQGYLFGMPVTPEAFADLHLNSASKKSPPTTLQSS